MGEKFLGTGSEGDGEHGGERHSPRLVDFIWIGTACAISVVGAGAIGYALDSAFGTMPWLTLVGLLFGIASAVMLTVSQVRKFI